MLLNNMAIKSITYEISYRNSSIYIRLAGNPLWQGQEFMYLIGLETSVTRLSQGDYVFYLCLT